MKGYYGTNISEKNTKMGNVLSFSTLPYRMCRKDIELPCAPNCYAAKICRLRKNVAKSWGDNTAMVEAEMFDEITSDIMDAIAFRHAKLFRWFVGGDIYSDKVMEMMIAIANSCPDTKFMCFTKFYDIAEKYHEEIPENLNIVLSAWKELQPTDAQKQLFPVNYYNDGEEDCQVPVMATVCGGDCEHCQLCFNMKGGESVTIYKH